MDKLYPGGVAHGVSHGYRNSLFFVFYWVFLANTIAPSNPRLGTTKLARSQALKTRISEPGTLPA